MTAPVILSASSVNTYQMCQLRWWFEYVAAIETDPSEPQAVGIAVHEHAELYLTAKSDEQVLQTDDPVVSPLVDVFTRDILPTYGEILLVEQPFQFDVNGIPFSGVIDSVDRHEETWGPEVIIRDLKTTGGRPQAGKYRFNMVGYFLGAQTLGIADLIGVQLDYIVRTLKPYYWPEFQHAPNDDEIEAWAVSVEIVAESIAQGAYEPTGLGTYVCSFCNFRPHCGPYQRLTSISPLREGSAK